MRYVDEFRDQAAARALAAQIAEVVADGRHYKVMEICGGHTHTIYRYGISRLLPENVEYVHGPGCPVCVIPMGRVDDAIALANRPEVTLCCFGDLVRVPGDLGSLLEAKARGARVRVVYSPLDALRVAREEPDRQVVFLAVGFETTAPSTALTLLRARAEGVANFSVLCDHVTIGPPVRAILSSPDLELDGMIGPGHVAVVIGTRPFDFVASEFGLPLVISGFEPTDLLQATLRVLRLRRAGRAEVANEYTRAVRPEGNPAALAVMDEVFETRPSFEWRGLGEIADSALRLREEWADLDAERRFPLPGRRVADPKACQCGEVLRGVLKPWQCKVFGTACTPESPIGTCMVSAEGACAAYYQFGRLAYEAAPAPPGIPGSLARLPGAATQRGRPGGVAVTS